MFVLRVTRALAAGRVPYALVGGYAVALHGAVRGTVDVDIVIRFRETDFLKAERSLQGIGLTSRLPVSASEVFRFRDEYVRNRSLTAWTFANPSRASEIVDIVVTEDLAGLDVRRVKLQGQILRIASIDDLIRMKQGTGRAQDQEDVRALKKLRGPLK